MGRHGGPRRRRAVGHTAGFGGAVTGALLAVVAGLAPAGHAAEAVPVPGTPCAPTAEACVDLAAGEAWLIRDGLVTYGPILVSSGAEGEETPIGTFRVEWKHIDHVSGESGVPMPFAVFFAPGGIAFHEGSIDSESAGCVRMPREAASVFFSTLQIGDEVEVR